ncbi:heparan-sulfate 6-O-sulfotransferase 2-like [Cervus canadensis]|uniref:heparan-sulfate 6-O-sulfotransferase 2-like n=1 Tax=Cervus canadensis TaxID=1574408 RepID=UPI001CA33FFF|nr:heparan-sulfate 6-O-sulfotransferase 2-like [Cervus canadensis]XP_043315281.1 heparan-sulfate 6-O-sulfotransferase 2-like [Cervus canadensis]
MTGSCSCTSKTGGTTFGLHPVGNIQLEQPYECRVGQKKCTCHRPGKRETWLFSRFSTGWSCGLHADWTELTSCVPAVVDGKRDARQRPSSCVVGSKKGLLTHYIRPCWGAGMRGH